MQVTSREYKLILNADRFQDSASGEASFWHIVEFLVGIHGGEVVERQSEIKTRKTWYIDTLDCSLRRNGWVVRVRKEKKKKYKLTLKLRAADRYVASAKDLSGQHPSHKGIDSKFEEDILPPFASKFAHSTSIKLANEPELSRMEQLVKIYPGLAELALAGETPLQIVNDFKAHESVHWTGKARFEEGHTVKSSLSYWYPTKDRAGIPLIAEFSFDYDLFELNGEQSEAKIEMLERFHVPTATSAAAVFRSLQKQNGWVRNHAVTKTAFAYDAF